MKRRLAWAGCRVRAGAWLLLDRPARALAVFDDMVRRFAPQPQPHALASRAHLLVSMGRRSEALPDLQAVVGLRPDDASAWFNLGFVLESEGRLDAALAAFQRATALDPKLDRAWYGLGLVLIRLRRLDDAVPALCRATELQPMSPHGWYQLARVQVERSEPEEARRIIGRLQGFEPAVAAQLQRETGLSGAPC